MLASRLVASGKRRSFFRESRCLLLMNRAKRRRFMWTGESLLLGASSLKVLQLPEDLAQFKSRRDGQCHLVDESLVKSHFRHFLNFVLRQCKLNLLLLKGGQSEKGLLNLLSFRKRTRSGGEHFSNPASIDKAFSALASSPRRSPPTARIAEAPAAFRRKKSVHEIRVDDVGRG